MSQGPGSSTTVILEGIFQEGKPRILKPLTQKFVVVELVF